MVGAAALPLDPLDPEQMASALGAFLAEPALRSQLAAAGPARAAQFSWAQTAGLLEQRLRQLA